MWRSAPVLARTSYLHVSLIRKAYLNEKPTYGRQHKHPGQASIHSRIDLGFTDPVNRNLEEVSTIERIELTSNPHEVIDEFRDSHIGNDQYALDIYGLVDQEDFAWSYTTRSIANSYLLVFFQFEACLTILIVDFVQTENTLCVYTRQITRKYIGINLLVQLKQ